MKKGIYLLAFLLLLSLVSAGRQSSGAIQVTMLNQDPDPAYPGAYVEVRFKVENLGDTLKDIEFQIMPEYPFSIEPYDNESRKIGTLYARQKGEDAAIVYYKLKIDRNAIEGNNTVRLRYRVGDWDYWARLDPYEVRVRTPDAILSVVDVQSIPAVIAPGQIGTIQVTIRNEADSLFRDIKLKWSPLTITSSISNTFVSSQSVPVTRSTGLEELPFTPIDSTNELSIYQLDPHEERVIPFKVMVSPTAVSKDYKMQLDITYHDHLGTEYEKSNILGLIVGMEPEVGVSIDKKTLTNTEMKGDVSIKVVNKGVVDLKFVNVELKDRECYTILSSPTMYIGKLDSDDYDTASFTLFAKKEPACENLPLMVSFKDSNNNGYARNITLPFKLYSKGEAQDMGLVEKSSWGWIMTLFILITGGIIGYRTYKKRKRS